MFAGAAREAVFSNSEVIRRVNSDFVPVALKAGLVDQPGDDAEAKLYRELRRSRPAPQGICVANSAGKALAWALTFEDDKQVLDFLDHGLKRFAQFPDGRQPVSTERFMRFASQRLKDIPDSGLALNPSDSHKVGEACPAQIAPPQGTIVTRIIGRAVDSAGSPIGDPARQEHYIEDKLTIPVSMQSAIADALANADSGWLRLPGEFNRLCVAHAYLGQLDVQPILNPSGGKTEERQCEFWVRRVEASKSVSLWRVRGRSEVVAGTDRRHGDGASFHNEIVLSWVGFIQMNGTRMEQLLLTARGQEKLNWSQNGRNAGERTRSAVAFLPAGRPIDLDTAVRFGFIGEPVATQP